MKKYLLILAIVSLAAGAVSAEDFQRVVLYQDMAYLTIERAASNGKLVIDAPPELIRDSISVALVSGGTIRSIAVEPGRLVAGKAGQLKEELAAKKATLEGIIRRQKTIERQIELIFEAAGSKDKGEAFSRTRMTEALSFIDEKVSALNRKHIELGSEREALGVRVKDLEEQLRQLSQKQGYRIGVHTDAAGPVRVSYAVTGGSWIPEYTVYADTTTGKTRIETTARVRQTTGIDWEAGELSVATGRPGFGIQAPELFPWRIGLRTPRHDAGALRQKSMMSAAPAMEELAAAEDFEAEVRETAASYVIGAARSVVLPGDGTSKSVVIQKKTIDTTLQRISAPKAGSGVFLRASGVWNGNAPILPGSYAAFVDGEFTGRGTMKQVRPDEKIKVDLGRDEGVSIDRKDKVFHEKTLTGKDRTTYTYTMEIRNARKAPVRISLKDQVPVSQDESVKVELISASPKAVPDEGGILAWEVECAPGAGTTVSFTFTVTGMPPL